MMQLESSRVDPSIMQSGSECPFSTGYTVVFRPFWNVDRIIPSCGSCRRECFTFLAFAGEGATGRVSGITQLELMITVSVRSIQVLETLGNLYTRPVTVVFVLLTKILQHPVPMTIFSYICEMNEL